MFNMNFDFMLTVSGLYTFDDAKWRKPKNLQQKFCLGLGEEDAKKEQSKTKL